MVEHRAEQTWTFALLQFRFPRAYRGEAGEGFVTFVRSAPQTAQPY